MQKLQKISKLRKITEIAEIFRANFQMIRGLERRKIMLIFQALLFTHSLDMSQLERLTRPAIMFQ